MGPATRFFLENVYGPAPAAEVDFERVAVRESIPAPGAPTFIGLNFTGNDDLPGHAWPIAEINARGYGVITAHYEAVLPDDASRVPPGTYAIASWAEYLRALRRAYAPRIGPAYAIGHSRLGKAALWAAALDEGFAGCVSIQSGCGGVAPIRSKEGETVAQITSMFPHWFHPAYAAQTDPQFDTYDFIAEITPRVVIALNAEEDRWADPDGQMEVMRRAKELRPDGRFHAHTRPGTHRVEPEDWHRAIDLIESG